MEKRERRIALASLGLCVALLGGAVLGQAPTSDLRGVVLDAQGNPVAGARVQLRVPDGSCLWRDGAHVAAEATTDLRGEFVLPRPGARMEFYASHPDHAPAWVPATDGATIRLPAACWVEFAPESPATLSVSRGEWEFARGDVDAPRRIGPLPPSVGLHWTAEADGYLPATGDVKLLPGETRRVDVELERGLSLEGRLVPPRGDAEVWCLQPGTARRMVTPGPDGGFAFSGLDEGHVRLLLLAPGADPRALDVDAGATVEWRWEQ